MAKTTYQPCILVVYAPMNHGKTTVAKFLATQSNLRHFDLDEIKRELFAEIPEPVSGSPESRSEENTRRTNAAYAEAARRAVELYRQGIPSIYSGTFSWASFKAPFVAVVDAKEAPVRAYKLEVDSLDEIRRRIKLRSKDPNVDVEAKLNAYLWSKEQQAKASWPGSVPTLCIDAEQDIEHVAMQIAKDLEHFK